MVMMILAVFRTGGADLYSYKYEYNHSFDINNSAGRYVGYKIIIQFFNYLGFCFRDYMVVFYIITFSLLLCGIRLLTTKINPVLSLYLIFPFGIDVVQMKSFLAEGIAFIGIALLLRTQTIKALTGKRRRITVLFVTIELISAMMHFSFLYFLFVGVLLLVFKRKRTIKKWIFRGLIVSVPAVYFGITGFIIRYAIKLGVIGEYDSRYMEQFFKIGTRFGAIIPTMWAVLLVYFVFHYKTGKVYNKGLAVNETNDEVLNAFMLTSIILIPFFLVNVYFSRLLRIYVIVAYVAYVSRKSCNKGLYFSISKSKAAFICAFGIGYWLDLLSVFNGTIGGILMHNSLFS